MVVNTASERAEKSRALVVELLAADQPDQPHDASSHFLDMAALNDVSESRFPAREACHVSLNDVVSVISATVVSDQVDS